MFRTSLESPTAWTEELGGVSAGGRENLPGFCVELGGRGRSQKFAIGPISLSICEGFACSLSLTRKGSEPEKMPGGIEGSSSRLVCEENKEHLDPGLQLCPLGRSYKQWPRWFPAFSGVQRVSFPAPVVWP